MSSLPTQLVLYDCDSVEVSYPDGATLQLSPCGACFAHCQMDADDSHPVFGERIIQQRTPYTISIFSDKVRNALSFRNRFAIRPYVCKEVVDPDSLMKLARDLVEFYWPSDVRSTDVVMLNDGSMQLSAAHQHATVTLAACQQLLTVRYLCRVGGAEQRRNIKMMSKCQESPAVNSVGVLDAAPSSTVDATSYQNESVQCGAAILKEGLWDYSWVTQELSVLSVPDCWQYPCQILVQFAKRSTNSVHFEDQGTMTEKKISCKNDEKRTYISTLIPEALPLNCSSLHLHKWMNKSEQDATALGRLKVISTQGVIYRIIDTPAVYLEIYPGDGSVMRSEHLAGHYFTHYSYKNGRVEERIHSVLHPPPDLPESLYSISKVIRRGARILEHICDENINLMRTSTPVCWQTDSSLSSFKEPLSSVILEQCTICGVGKFTAHSSGRIRIVFDDRTTLDMIMDWPSRIWQNQKHNHGNGLIDIQHYNNQFVPTHGSDLPKNMCRLLLPNGHYHYINVTTPGQYQRYIQAALEWVKWVNASSDDRRSFYKDTIHDEDRLNSVQEEMRKIRCFNYIIENTVMSQFSHAKDKPDPEDESCDDERYRILDRLVQVNIGEEPHHLSRSTGSVATGNKMSSPSQSMSTNWDDEFQNGDYSCVSQSITTNTLDKSKELLQVNNDHLSYQVVQDVLLKTSEKIKELDSFLSSHRQSSASKEA